MLYLKAAAKRVTSMLRSRSLVRVQSSLKELVAQLVRATKITFLSILFKVKHNLITQG